MVLLPHLIVFSIAETVEGWLDFYHVAIQDNLERKALFSTHWGGFLPQWPWVVFHTQCVCHFSEYLPLGMGSVGLSYFVSGWVELVGLVWVGLGWVGLDWFGVGPGWVGLGSVLFGWVVLSCVRLSEIVLSCYLGSWSGFGVNAYRVK